MLKKDFLLIVARKTLRLLRNPPSFRPRNSINFRYQNGKSPGVALMVKPCNFGSRGRGVCEFKASLAYIVEFQASKGYIVKP